MLHSKCFSLHTDLHTIKLYTLIVSLINYTWTVLNGNDGVKWIITFLSNQGAWVGLWLSWGYKSTCNEMQQLSNTTQVRRQKWVFSVVLICYKNGSQHFIWQKCLWNVIVLAKESRKKNLGLPPLTFSHRWEVWLLSDNTQSVVC